MTWPSGETPLQLIPYPQTTLTPQDRSVPARSTAKVSLRTTSRPVMPRAVNQRAMRRSSAGRSAPARQYTPRSATGNAGSTFASAQAATTASTT